MRARPIAPLHMTQGSIVTKSVVPSNLQFPSTRLASFPRGLYGSAGVRILSGHGCVQVKRTKKKKERGQSGSGALPPQTLNKHKSFYGLQSYQILLHWIWHSTWQIQKFYHSEAEEKWLLQKERKTEKRKYCR